MPSVTPSAGWRICATDSEVVVYERRTVAPPRRKMAKDVDKRLRLHSCQDAWTNPSEPVGFSNTTMRLVRNRAKGPVCNNRSQSNSAAAIGGIIAKVASETTGSNRETW